MCGDIPVRAAIDRKLFFFFSFVLLLLKPKPHSARHFNRRWAEEKREEA
jgi:hypothetical protein